MFGLKMALQEGPLQKILQHSGIGCFLRIADLNQACFRIVKSRIPSTSALAPVICSIMRKS